MTSRVIFDFTVASRQDRRPIIFQEWTDTRTFSDLKYTSTKIWCILIDNERFPFAHKDKNMVCLHAIYSTVHSQEKMDSLIMAKYGKCILKLCRCFSESYWTFTSKFATPYRHPSGTKSMRKWIQRLQKPN